MFLRKTNRPKSRRRALDRCKFLELPNNFRRQRGCTPYPRDPLWRLKGNHAHKQVIVDPTEVVSLRTSCDANRRSMAVNTVYVYACASLCYFGYREGRRLAEAPMVQARARIRSLSLSALPYIFCRQWGPTNWFRRGGDTPIMCAGYLFQVRQFSTLGYAVSSIRQVDFAPQVVRRCRRCGFSPKVFRPRRRSGAPLQLPHSRSSVLEARWGVMWCNALSRIPRCGFSSPRPLRCTSLPASLGCTISDSWNKTHIAVH